jgi:hypothetical protein
MRNQPPIVVFCRHRQAFCGLTGPYPIRTRTMRIGEMRAKGYFEEDFQELFRRYIPRSAVEAFGAELTARNEPQTSREEEDGAGSLG